MDASSLGGPLFIPILWAALWSFVWLYVAWRFLKAFERGIQAHERLADAMMRVPPVLAGLTSPERAR